MDVKVCSLYLDSFRDDFVNSLIDTGFAVVTDHGISEGLIRDTAAVWKRFFLSGNEIKSIFVNEEDGNMGWKRMLSEKAIGATQADLKEFFHWKPKAKIPYDVSHLTQVMFSELSYLANELLEIIDDEEDTNYRFACKNSNNTLLRTLYYPAMNFDSANGAVRAAAHEDINFITLLVAASAPGLQVLDKAGVWHNVPHEDNSIVVNIGDMMQLASQGKYKSTTHRVVNPKNNRLDRISMPLFIHPNGDTELVPGTTAQQYLKQRLDEIYMKVK